MGSWNLENFNNRYASLAQSAYKGRPVSFPKKSKTKVEKIDFSQDVTYKGKVTEGATGDDYPKKSDPDAKKTDLYLQPDKDLHKTKDGQKGLMTDEKAGFNAYYVSDTKKIDSSTKNTYFVVRGSDGMKPKNFNDWILNDARFAVTGDYIPQAKLANKAMKEKIAELKTAAPNAKMNVTGHSLGTMVSAQAVANLSYDELKAVE